MKERPILFSAPMVRAILECRKTVTRRIVKKLPERVESITNIEVIDPVDGWVVVSETQPRYSMACPYGQAEDQLWVRETWGLFQERKEFGALYRADYNREYEENTGVSRWRPSIHMPRWACRLSLEITGVKVERLQDITEAEAKAEGAPLMLQSGQATWLGDPDDYPMGYSHLSGFQWLWESINGAGSWAANPWVWAVSFQTAKPA